MQGIMKFTFLGMDEFTGKKDPSKKYHQVSLLQGSEIAKVFLDAGQEVLFQDLEKFDEVECVLMFKLGQDRYGAKIDYRLISMTPLMPELPFDMDKTPEADSPKEKAPEALPPTEKPSEYVPTADRKNKSVA